MLHSINPQYCQERAVQARALANRTTEPEAREAILAVAEQYEHLAQRGEVLRRRHGGRYQHGSLMLVARAP